MLLDTLTLVLTYYRDFIILIAPNTLAIEMIVGVIFYIVVIINEITKWND